jgi:hypothetical protein
MSFKHGFKIRASLLVAAMLIISLASTRLSADSGVCAGQTTNLPFTDVPASNIFFCSIATAYFSGLTNGTSATTYSPAANVPREQMAAFVTRTLDQGLRRGKRRAALDQWWTPTLTDSFGETQVGGGPSGVKSDGQDLWVANFDSTVSRVRASDGKLLETWTGAQSALGVLVAKGRVFVTGQTDLGRLYMIDPTQPPGPVTVLSSSVGASSEGIAFDGERIWIANRSGDSISIYRLSTTLTTITGFGFPTSVLYDGANIWVTDFGGSRLLKVDSTGNVIQSISTDNGPFYPVFDGTNIWVPNLNTNTVTVIRVKDALGNPLPAPPAVNAPFVLAMLTGNGLTTPRSAAFDGERILVVGGDRVSLWKATDLTPLGFRSTLFGDDPFAACSDGVNFGSLLIMQTVSSDFEMHRSSTRSKVICASAEGALDAAGG